MGLFVQREDTGLAKGFYVLQKGTTKLIVGLGNIGDQYVMNRHNAGFLTLDHFADQNHGSWTTKKALKCDLTEVRLGENKVILVKPHTMMNLSGDAVSAVQRFYKITNTDTAVVYDELDMPFGTVRGRLAGSSGGHNGVKSLIKHIGEDFTRIRIGISNEHSSNIDTADFVLANFSRAEQAKLPSIITLAEQQITDFVSGEFKPHTLSDK